jgi:hypothetical protein
VHSYGIEKPADADRVDHKDSSVRIMPLGISQPYAAWVWPDWTPNASRFCAAHR